MSPTPRAVVIGAGHNGLVAAVHLAEAGLDVTVLEQGPRAGGASRSQEATLPGFIHDHCAGFFPMTAASPVGGDTPNAPGVAAGSGANADKVTVQVAAPVAFHLQVTCA